MYVVTLHMDKNVCIYAYIHMLTYKYMCAVNICQWVWGYIW